MLDLTLSIDDRNAKGPRLGQDVLDVDIHTHRLDSSCRRILVMSNLTLLGVAVLTVAIGPDHGDTERP